MDEALVFRTLFYSILIALLIHAPAVWLARRVGLLDIPNKEPHKRHSIPMPLTGGVVLFITFLVVSLAYRLWSQPGQWFILLAFGLVFLFGLLDDRFCLPPLVKLIGQMLAGAVLMASGTQVHLFNNQSINLAITFIWLVGITNAVNFVDSMDGLAVGLGAITSAFFMLVTLDSGQLNLMLLSLIMLGGCLVGFYFNAMPARAFLGDSGSQLLGLFLATMGLAYNPVGFSPFASWYVPILLLGVPVFDTVLVVFSRMRRGMPIYRSNLDHSYHRLVKLGLSPTRAVLTIHFVALMLDCVAFIALNSPPVLANLIFAVIALGGAGVILFFDHPSRWPGGGLATNRPAVSQPPPTNPQPASRQTEPSESLPHSDPDTRP